MISWTDAEVKGWLALRFMDNVEWARECGYDLVCALCGAGIYDESDMHESHCPAGTDDEA